MGYFNKYYVLSLWPQRLPMTNEVIFDIKMEVGNLNYL